jgi:hypothetical protein
MLRTKTGLVSRQEMRQSRGSTKLVESKEMKIMVRLLAAILIVCSLTAQLSAQAAKDQASPDQTSKNQALKDQASKDQASTGQTAPASAEAQWPLDDFKEFSAVMVGSINPMDHGESYIYRSGNLMRNSGEGHNFVITNLTTGESYGVSAPGCMHDSHPYFDSLPFALIRPGVKVERVVSGQETVDGHSCKIEDVTLTFPKLTRKLRFWEAEDLQGFPIQVKFFRGFGHDPVIRYKNVVLGPQDPTLFIYPNSCEKSLGYNSKLPKAAPKAKKPAAAPPGTPQN